MIGNFGQSKYAPTLNGIMQSTSSYGATIPRIFGTVLASPLITWMNGLRQAPTSKKGGSKKSGHINTYRSNCNALLGHNPILSVLRCWANGPLIGDGVWYNKVLVAGNTTIAASNFHQVIGVTAILNYNQTFNDYGSQGAFTLSGSYEIPLWNLALQGPNPTNSHGYRFAPYTYFNLPQSNVVNQLNVPGNSGYYIYYTTVHTSGWRANRLPLDAVLNAFFESSLGDGSEYTSYQNYSAQQIIYPHYAGIASGNFDLGMGSAPQMKVETMGTHSLYPDGINSLAPGTNLVIPDPGGPHPSADADFADMIEDILRQGQTQAALLSDGTGNATAYATVQTGCSCWEFPGATQKKFWTQGLNGNFPGTITFDLPVMKGDVLVVAVAQSSTGSNIGVSDSLGNSWSTVVATPTTAFFYAQANAQGTCTVTISNSVANADVQIFSIAGCDTVDSAISAIGTGTVPSASVTTTNTTGQNAYILTWVNVGNSANVGTGFDLFWNPAMLAANQGGNTNGVGPAISFSEYRLVASSGTYDFENGTTTAPSWTVCMLALKNAVAPAFPKPYGDIIDDASLQQTRLQCRANGLFGSLYMSQQRSAKDWLMDLGEAADCYYVWSGFKLKCIPRSEVSMAGNGAIYTAWTAAGPTFNLGIDDMIGSPGSPYVSIERKAVVDRPDLLRYQFNDRNNQYRPGTVSQPDPGSLTLQGLRYASPKKMDMLPHVNVAQMILGIAVRRETMLLNTYKFKLQARFKLLEAAADLVTITDPTLGLFQQPVRFTSITEDDKFNLDCEAEDFFYGLHDPTPVPNAVATISTPNNPQSGYVPANVNAPVFLEPPGQLTGVPNDQLWIDVSCNDALYGGSQVYVSVNGGGSYSLVPDITGTAIVLGNAVTGNTTANWAQALDPDTTNNLNVNVAESLGVLQQYTTNQEDQFLYPCYVAGGGGIFPFELMTYAVANLTASFQYTLVATGGGGNHLRRAVFGTWAGTSTPNTGPAHVSGSRFAFLDPSGNGLMKINVPPAWVGVTLFFKFVQFNVFGGGSNTLANSPAFSYTVLGNNNGPGGGTGGSGGGGSSSYTISPTNPLSQPSSTDIHMVNVVASWTPSGLQTFYFQRDFTIPAPSTPLTYYVTVYDPNQTGDTGAAATLTSFCANTQAGAHVGQAGYIYMGSITAIAGGGGTGTGGGGSNPPNAFYIEVNGVPIV